MYACVCALDHVAHVYIQITNTQGIVNKLYLLGTNILPPKLLRKVTELAWSDL